MLVIDNYIKDKKILEAFQDENTWKNMPSLNWWDGWWKTEPRNIFEYFTKLVWKQNTDVENKIAGFEYWSNIHQTGGSLDWHVDKDEKLITDKKELVMPRFGLIYYVLVNDLEGGYLEIANSRETKNINPENVQRLRAIENRLIMFNPSNPHRVTEITKGKRRALLVNAWGKKPFTFLKNENVNRLLPSREIVDIKWENKFKKNF